MFTVGAVEAEAKVAELLDRVAAGETVLITRRGVPAALMTPPDRLRRGKAESSSEIRRFRKRCVTGKVGVETLIDEGRA